MLKAIWDQFLQIVREEEGSRVVETWLKAVSLYQWDARQQVAYLLAPNMFVKEWIKSHYMHLFNTHLKRLFHVDELKIVFIEAHQERATGSSSIIPASRIPSVHTNKKLVSQKNSKNRYSLNRNYRFETFVKGPNNQMAYAAAVAITQKLGRLYNPLFIYGKSGLGKTHLLHAMANELKEQQDDLEILYQPADRFVNEFINAIRFDKMHRFQTKYKNVDVFLVDDIQCISNKEQTQEAFFHIFNAMYDAHKQIVFSSDSYPSDINGLAERLRSRLEWGLVADVQAPTLETKIAIIKRKAELNDHEITDEVAYFIASHALSNIRELEGALIRVVAFASITKQPITVELAKKVLLRADVQQEKKAAITLEAITRLVGKRYSYNLTELRSKNRNKQLSQARQVAMYLMKRYTTKSLRDIALYFNRNDHSTVIHAFKQISERSQEDDAFCQQLKHLEHELYR